MSKTTENARTVAEIQLELGKATQAFNALQQEQAGIRERLKDAGKADQDALTKAGLSGSMKGAKTPKLDAVWARAAELPYLVWAAEIRMLQLQEERVEAKRAELRPQVRELGETSMAAEDAFEEAPARLDEVRQEHTWALDELRELDRGGE